MNSRQYLSEWTSLTSLLTPSNSTPRFGVSVPGSSERTHLKEAATAFFDRLTELEGVCSQFPLSRQDPEMRDRVGREVEEMVVGAYGVFVGRCSGKGLEKCESSPWIGGLDVELDGRVLIWLVVDLKGGVEDVGRRVMGCFR